MRLFVIFGILIFSFQTFAQNKNVALKFDEVSIPQNEDGNYTVYKETAETFDSVIVVYEKDIEYSRITRFAQEVLKYTNSKAYIIFYNQRKGR